MNNNFLKTSSPQLKNYRKWITKWPKKYIKHKYHTPDGKKLAAGGILFFDIVREGKGIWVVKEGDDGIGTDVYTDLGGKYAHDDGDIYATVSREFREETYNTNEIPYMKIKKIPEDQHLYINGYDGTPVYLCIIAHINEFQINFDAERLDNAKKEILAANPNVPNGWYRTKAIEFILLKDIAKGKYRLSNRLYAILKILTTEENSMFNKEIVDFFFGHKIVQKI